MFGIDWERESARSACRRDRDPFCFKIRKGDRKLDSKFRNKIPQKLAATEILAYSFGLSKQTVTVIEGSKRKREKKVSDRGYA